MNKALTRWVLTWAIRRALRPGRGSTRLAFLSGVAVGAGLLYLVAAAPTLSRDADR